MAAPITDAIRTLQARGYTVRQPGPARPQTLHEKAVSMDWEKIADRNQPLPDGLTLDQFMHVFQDFLVVQLSDQFLR